MNDSQIPDPFEQRVRHSLHTIAGSVTEDSFVASTETETETVRKPRHRRRVALGVGAVALPFALAAAMFVRQGPEYVDTIPPEQIVMSGSVDGSRYLLIETERTDECGNPRTGIELVEESKNLIGSEWSTTGYEYGEQVERPCGYVNDTSRFLQDRALFDSSGAEVGDSFVWIFSVHPDIEGVRITSGDYTEDLNVYQVDGAGYAPFEMPGNIKEYTSELLVGGQVVPGSQDTREVPER